MTEGKHPIPIPQRTFLDSLKDFWPYVVGIVVAGWAAFTWISNHQNEVEKQNQARLFEARKPFLEKQLALYYELVQLAGPLAVDDPKSDEWKSRRKRFEQLAFADVPMLADEKVARALIDFRSFLDKRSSSAEKNDPRHGHVETFALAQAIRAAIQRTWLPDPKEYGIAVHPVN